MMGRRYCCGSRGRRMGANVILLERYNHVGGLSTGGLVIWIDRMTDWSGNLVIRGFAEELFNDYPPPMQLRGLT
jgi:FAD dependent oxidoreductase